MRLLNKEATLAILLDSETLQGIARFQAEFACYSMVVADDKLIIVRYDYAWVRFSNAAIDTHFASVAKFANAADAVVGFGRCFVEDAIRESYLIEKSDCLFIFNDESVSEELKYFARFISERV
ncbi:hypothetical protein [Ferrovum sp.]|uniref:hypothetical protein n=1 Tax=Ferrovum sp. TaxID=2609467 RepID=UPI00262A022B|nr:hypothetical protein [Ferrovum sp.]